MRRRETLGLHTLSGSLLTRWKTAKFLLVGSSRLLLEEGGLDLGDTVLALGQVEGSAAVAVEKVSWDTGETHPKKGDLTGRAKKNSK
jgi:hypothetical protein